MNRYAVFDGDKEVVRLGSYACFSGVPFNPTPNLVVKYEIAKHKDHKTESEWYLKTLKDIVPFEVVSETDKILNVNVECSKNAKALATLTLLRLLDQNELNCTNVLPVLQKAFELKDKFEPFHTILMSYVVGEHNMSNHGFSAALNYILKNSTYYPLRKLISFAKFKENLEKESMNRIWDMAWGPVVSFDETKKICAVLEKDVEAGYKLLL